MVLALALSKRKSLKRNATSASRLSGVKLYKEDEPMRASVLAAVLLSVPPSTPLGASAYFGVQAPTDLFAVQAPTPLKHYTSPRECGFAFITRVTGS